MKRKLLFAILMIASVLGLRAQTDVTATYLTNPSFEADGVIAASNGSNPNMITPTGWTQEQNAAGSFQNNRICDASTSNESPYGTLVTPSDGTYYLFYRHGWNGSNYAKFTSTAANMPAGFYTLTVDYKMVSGSDNTNNNNNTSITLSAISGGTTLGENTASDAVKVNNNGTTAVLANDEWKTLTTSFTLTEETSTQIVINLLACGPKRSDFVVDNVRILYVAFVYPTAITLGQNSLSLSVGENATLTPSFTPSDANTDTDITWTTSDATVATVSNGVVTAIGGGTATITATTANNKSATCTVTVNTASGPAHYSEIAAGDFYIVNAATGMFLGGAHSWGTQASLIEHGIPFTVTVGNGVYTLDSHSYNNANDHFLNGTYVDGGSTNLYITSLGSGKYSISTASGSAYLIADAATLIAANTAADASNPLAQWYFLSKADRDALFADATDANPADATYYLTEANISRNLRKSYGVSGWTGDFAYGGWNENQCAERYCANTNVYQTVTVPNGKYTVKCQGFYRRQSAENTSYLYANEVEQALNRIEFGGVNSMDGASEAFSNGEYWNELTVYVTNGELTVGIKCDANTNWTIWDNFELYYHGPTIGGEAELLPETDMTADKWYYFDVAVDGDYVLNTTSLGNIVYTTDGTTLIENGSNVTTHFANTTPVTLTAGRYYVKSTTAQTLSVDTYAFSYSVGNAVFSVADGGYTQTSTITVTFPDAATNDPDGVAGFIGGSTATVNGASVNLTAVTNGFSLDLGTLTPGTAYTISIPAGVYGYADEDLNAAISLTVNTPAVFDGEYVLYDATAKLFLGRGNEYGTEASADKYGVPFNLTTDATGASSFEFVDWPNVYLFITGTSIYTDNASTGWKLVPTSGGYYLRDANLTIYATHSAGTFGEYVHTTDNESAATVWTLKTKAERDAIIAAYPTDNIQNVIDATNIETTAADFKSYLTNNFRSKDFTNSIGTPRFAGSAGDWTWTGTARTQGGQPAYGTDFAEVWNATGAYTQTISGLMEGIYRLTVQGYERRKNNNDATALHDAGYNLVSTFMSANGEQVRFTDWNDVDGKPTNTGGAVAAFNNGEAVNELYVYLDGSEDLTITVRKPNYIWDCWMIMNNFTLTRYYTEDYGGLDEEDQLLESLHHTAGDFDSNGTIEGTDIQTLVNILVGKNTDYDAEVADVDGENGVTLADLTQLVNVFNGTAEARNIDDTYTYANVNATVYAEQDASENASDASYMLNSATCTLTNEDVTSKYTDIIGNYMTKLNIAVSLSNVKSVSVYAKGQENIAGLVTIAVRGDETTYTYSAGETPNAYVNNDRSEVNGKNMQSDVVTVTGDNAGTYVAYLLPVALSNGVTVTVRDGNGKFYSQDFTTIEVGQENELTFTETTATNNWMATIPGNVNFSMLSTPGSHNSATSNCSSAAKCQNETIAEQLENGVRAFDLRPTYKYSSKITADNLLVYHGMVSTGVLYKNAIKAMVEFLQAHPTEAISIIMVKEDGTPLLSSWTDYTTEMCNAIDEIHSQYTDYFKMLDHSYYTLDEFRGKIFTGYRNAWDLHKTVRVTNWPDDNSVTDYSCAIGNTCSASVEDAYNTSGDSKKDVVNALLDLASANTNRARFHYTFTSVANSITSSANTQNPAAAQYISGTLTGPTGYVYADFMGSSSYSGQTLLKAVIEQNYKYVNKGRSRCE